MHHDRKLENCPFRGPLFVKKNPAREHLLQVNHKLFSQTKGINKKTYTSRSHSPKSAIARHQPKMNSVHFEDP